MSFGSDLKRITQKRSSDLTKVARMATFEVGTKIVIRTPVDSGSLIGNWLWASGAPNATFSETKTGANESNGQLNVMLSTFDPSQVGYFTNSMPYAYRIEYEGWSSNKRPEGMVRVSVAEFSGIVERIVAGLR